MGRGDVAARAPGWSCRRHGTPRPRARARIALRAKPPAPLAEARRRDGVALGVCPSNAMHHASDPKLGFGNPRSDIQTGQPAMAVSITRTRS